MIALARSELRRHGRSLALLTALVAIVAWAILTAAAGVRRTETVLDRYLEATQAPDAMVGVAEPRFGSDVALVEATAAQLETIDGVREVAAIIGLGADVGTALDFTIEVAAGDGPPAAARAAIVEGRAPAPDAPTELALSELAADELGLGVGDVLVARTMRPDTAAALVDGDLPEFVLDGPVLDFEVVGIVRDVASLAPGGGFNPTGYGSAALLGTEEVAAWVTSFEIDGDLDASALDASYRIVGHAAEAVGGQPEVFGGQIAGHVAPIRTAVDSLATGLAIATAIAVVAGLIALTLAIARHLQLGRDQRRIVEAVGATRRMATAAAGLPVAAAVVAGMVLATGAAIVASPLFPISVARRAELATGVRVEPFVLFGGAAALTVALLGVVAVLAWRPVRPTRSSPTAAGRWSRFTRALPPATAIGCASVVPAPGGRPATVRSGMAIAGIAVGVAGAVAVAVFLGSQRHTITSPDRYGWTWDASPDLYAGEVDPNTVVRAMSEHDRLDAVGGLFCSEGLVEDRRATSCAFVAASGRVAPRVVDGRAPSAAGEVALLQSTAAELGVGIGDRVEIAGSSETQSLVVIGTVLLPGNVFEDIGEGAVVTADDLERLTGRPVAESDERRLLLTYADGVDVAALETELEAQYPVDFSAYSLPQPPDLITQLDRLRPVLTALAAFLGALGLIALVHFLALSARERRGDIGVLKALGFVRGQVRSIVRGQGMTVAVIGLIVGLPVGILTGRSAWLVTVDQLEIVDTPVSPVATAAAIVAVAVCGAAAVSTAIGWWAARAGPAEALRTE